MKSTSNGLETGSARLITSCSGIKGRSATWILDHVQANEASLRCFSPYHNTAFQRWTPHRHQFRVESRALHVQTRQRNDVFRHDECNCHGKQTNKQAVKRAHCKIDSLRVWIFALMDPGGVGVLHFWADFGLLDHTLFRLVTPRTEPPYVPLLSPRREKLSCREASSWDGPGSVLELETLEKLTWRRAPRGLERSLAWTWLASLTSFHIGLGTRKGITADTSFKRSVGFPKRRDRTCRKGRS